MKDDEIWKLEWTRRCYRRLDLKLHWTKKTKLFGMDYCMHSNMALTTTKLTTHQNKNSSKKNMIHQVRMELCNFFGRRMWIENNFQTAIQTNLTTETFGVIHKWVCEVSPTRLWRLTRVKLWTPGNPITNGVFLTNASPNPSRYARVMNNHSKDIWFVHPTKKLKIKDI